MPVLPTLAFFVFVISFGLYALALTRALRAKDGDKEVKPASTDDGSIKVSLSDAP